MTAMRKTNIFGSRVDLVEGRAAPAILYVSTVPERPLEVGGELSYTRTHALTDIPATGNLALLPANGNVE